LVRSGAVLPLLPPRVDTLADYGNRVQGLATLAESRRRLRLLAFPHGRTTSHFNRAERLRSSEGRGEWTLQINADLRRTYRLDASLATLRQPFTPCAVEVDGSKLAPSRWSYGRSGRVLRASFHGRDPVFKAIGCG
jgi:hypothetical protein